MEKYIHYFYDTVLGNIEKAIGLIMFGSISIQVICRYLPVTPFAWTDELARLCFIWFCFLGSAMTLEKARHLGVDYFYRKLGKSGRKTLDVAMWLLILMFAALLVGYGIRLLGYVSIQKSAVLRISMVYFYGAVPVTGVLFGIYGGYSLCQSLKGKERKQPED